MQNTSLALLSLGLALSGSAALASSSGKHNGTWSVQMVTESGICDRSYTYAIAIEDGRVRYIQAPGDSPTTVAGRVAADGKVDLDIRRSVAKVDAVGQLNLGNGSGSWRLGMLGCSGRWTARRTSTTVAG